MTNAAQNETVTRAFSDENVRAFGGAYPETTLSFHHQLCGHPLFSLEALAALGARMPAELTEYNSGGIDLNEPDETRIPKNEAVH